MKNGPVAAIFEADGGAWKLETMMRIKAYLEEQLQEYKDKVEIIALLKGHYAPFYKRTRRDKLGYL